MPSSIICLQIQGGLVACVSYHISHCEALFQPFVQPIERDAVVNIACIDCYIKNIPVLVAGSLSGVGKAFLMLAFVENSAFRIGFGFGYYFLFGWVSAVKRLLAVVFTILVYFVQQLLAVNFGSLRNGSANGFFLFVLCSTFLSPFLLYHIYVKKPGFRWTFSTS